MKRTAFCAGALLLSTTGAYAQYGPQPYTPVRWDENYSYLSDPAARTDWADPIKYIPLNEDGSVHLSFGGQARYRYEFFDNANFGAGPQDGSGFHLFRFLPHADLHAGEHVRVFVQGLTAWEDGRHGGPRATDENEIALQQAFVDLKGDLTDDVTGTLRVGRQDLIYGAQRLISPLDWANTRRTFQGAKASFTMDVNTLDLFWVQPVVVDRQGWDEGNDDVDFGGAYYVRELPNFISKEAKSRVEAYGLYIERDAPGAIEQERFTLGTRFRTAPKPWDVDTEFAYQFGDAGDDSVNAWSFAVEGGYTLADVALAPRLFLGFDAASGGDPGERFDQLFPLGHAYFGYIDVVGRQNIIDLHPGFILNLKKNLTLRTEQHFFWRQDTDDALFNAAGAVQRADTGTDARFVGSELDLLLNWQITRHWTAYAGYSHFWAGDFIDDTGPSEDIDFIYAAAIFTF